MSLFSLWAEIQCVKEEILSFLGTIWLFFTALFSSSLGFIKVSLSVCIHTFRYVFGGLSSSVETAISFASSFLLFNLLSSSFFRCAMVSSSWAVDTACSPRIWNTLSSNWDCRTTTKKTPQCTYFAKVFNLQQLKIFTFRLCSYNPYWQKYITLPVLNSFIASYYISG